MIIERFVRYAAAFEESYESGDFAPLAPFFTEDAVYEIHAPGRPDQRHEGRDAVLAYMAWITTHFDKRFAERKILRAAGPFEKENTVEVVGIAVYTLATGERSFLSMSECAHFRGDRISRLVDDLSPGGAHEMHCIVGAHPDRFAVDVLSQPSPDALPG